MRYRSLFLACFAAMLLGCSGATDSAKNRNLDRPKPSGELPGPVTPDVEKATPKMEAAPKTDADPAAPAEKEPAPAPVAPPINPPSP
ncbi:hypothetical protein [Tuwongella immobilis]|uniref:Lipoprotein n=1 Tax=Tuwongella immobilis TaxID=692036 RepID=A0A6C2YX70_9BACT|nr:hypothetical protein [Tuwongella immobilis]VIP05489.1 unnamed protein product [Tuwongella immobilis]VTS08334.1 unnamed protein product [Tuwongella immobilis]